MRSMRLLRNLSAGPTFHDLGAGVEEAPKVDLLWGSFKHRPEKGPAPRLFLARTACAANSPCHDVFRPSHLGTACRGPFVRDAAPYRLLQVAGADAPDFLQRLCTQDLLALRTCGDAAPAAFLDPKGKV